MFDKIEPYMVKKVEWLDESTCKVWPAQVWSGPIEFSIDDLSEETLRVWPPPKKTITTNTSTDESKSRLDEIRKLWGVV